MDEVPANLKNAAIAQIVAGLINIFFMGCASWMGIGTVCGVLTLGMGGQFCGLLSCAIWPLGILEIIVGGLALSNPKEFGKFTRIFGFIELAGILFGSLSSLIIGGIVVAMTGNDEVKAYLEG